MTQEADHVAARHEALDHRVGRLNDLHRQVLADRYYEHKSREQIAGD